MKSGKYVGAAALLLSASLALRGELQEWVQRLPAGPLISIFFRSVSMPDGAVAIRRNPSETRAALNNAILVKPAVSNLYRLRAHEDERALDFTAAEADWRKYAQLSRNHIESYTELADYYHRREQGAKEIQALQTVASAKTGPLTPLDQQIPWKATERILAVVDEEGFAPAISSAALDSWIGLHPTDQHAYQRAIGFYVEKKQFDRAQSTIDAYARQFPGDLVFRVRERASLELSRGSAEKALAIYDASFAPLWPAELSASWFELLQSQEQSSAFVARARKVLQTNPADLDATARLFHFYLNNHNEAEARRVLDEYRLAKQTPGNTWKPDELWIVGQLFERLPDFNESARSYYAMYSATGVTDADATRALAALANLLLVQPDQPIAFGSGDLSFYRDVAQADSSPGFLNGILSLLFNSASPRREYEDQNLKSTAYFHRSAGARLVDFLAQRFPKADQLPELRAELVQAYATYSDNEMVVRSGREYLAAFPNAPRVQVAMLTCDALANLNRVNEEFAIYDDLLRELSNTSQHVPLGENAGNSGDPSIAVRGAPPANTARSPEYQHVLDRYLARLSSLDRPMDALRLYRREIDRNPDDPGLYRQFAAYLDSNHLSTQLIETYRRAMERFPDRSWYQSLARWYLREKRANDFEHLTHEVTEIFSGSDLEQYFSVVVGPGGLDARLYLELNLYAHQRFPNDFAFVHNLLDAYRSKGTLNLPAYQELLRIYWYYDDGLKRDYLSDLSASGRLSGEIDEIRKANPAIAQNNWKQAAADNPAAVQFVAEAESWRSHFEAAAPAFRAMAEAAPGDRSMTQRGSSIYRSLAAYFPEDTQIAVNLVDLAYRSDPRDRDLLANKGDIYADRDQLKNSRPIWNSILKIEPGKTDSWLSAATVFWDYYMFNDALRVIAAGRSKFADPVLFAYQEGAIYEGERDYTRAIQQYAAGAVHGDNSSQTRLLRLAHRKSTAEIVDRVTQSLAPDPGKAPAKVRDLRVAVLEAQNRRTDLEAFLNAALSGAQTVDAAAQIAAIANRDGFNDIEERATLAQFTLTVDPIEKMRQQIQLAHFYAARGDGAKAEQTMSNLYRADPKVLGVVRATVDFEKQQNKPDRAIEILLEAAKNARTDLASQFTLEAARTATEAGQFERARTMLAGLLKADPYRADYLTAQADTYGRAKDDAGFAAFTLATIKSLQASPLGAGDRTDRIAALRRGLIPVLTRQGEFDRATDQYIEVINRFPEDDGLAREAAQYAIAHNRLDQLLTFYRKTIHDAPRDYRWPIVLARVETAAADYPAAIDSYNLAMKDRPDRADLPEARGLLEERLLRFDDAIKTFSKLYELTYHDPQWLERIASLQARMGRAGETVKDLQTAIIGDRKESASALLDIANRLDGWNMVKEALPFAERGQALSKDPQRVYYRILARARQMDPVFDKNVDFIPATDAAAEVVSVEYSPEEKAHIEQHLDKAIDWLPFARQAGMAPLEAQLLMRNTTYEVQHVSELNALQMRRGLFEDLGKEMERLAENETTPELRSAEENDAGVAYVAEGDRANAMRFLTSVAARQELPGSLRDWFLATLSKTEPERLVQWARDSHYSSLWDSAVQYAIANDDAALAQRAVAARFATEDPVWSRAFTALTGVYFADPSPSINTAFTGVLNNDATIGARVKSPANLDEQIAGSLWFYYGARYGEYLANLHRAAAPQFLPASLEQAPGNPEAYMQLAAFYEGEDTVANALARYREALQLDSNRGDAHDHMARILAQHGKRAAALQEWRAAIAVYEQIQSRGFAVPEFFWTQSTETIADIGSNGALRELQPDLARWIGAYAQRNGQYRLTPLLDAAFDAALDAHAGTKWVLDIAVDYASEDAFNGFLSNPRLTAQQRVELQRRRVEVTKNALLSAHGNEETRLQIELNARRVELVSKLIDAGDAPSAAAEWDQVSDEVHRQNPREELFLAAATHSTDKILTLYRAKPERAPAMADLLDIITQLRNAKFDDAALSVAEFTYRRELDNQNLDAANFLGLAGVMLERLQTADAVALLRRMNLVSGEPFETLMPAADLLQQHGISREAIPFLRDRVRAVPWDAEARVQLAKLLAGAEKDSLLNGVIGDPYAPYDLRVDAVEALAPKGTTAVPVDSEIALLASASVSIASAEKPYRVAARVKAAKGKDALRLLREASAIAPGNADVRIAEVRAALAAGRDNLALSLVQVSNGNAAPQFAPNPEVGQFRPGRRRFRRFVPRFPAMNESAPLLERSDLSTTEKAALTEDLSKAAERVDDFAAAISYEQSALGYRSNADKTRLEALQKEQGRRIANASRQPVIGPSLEQRSIVQPKILAGKAE